MKLGYQDAGSWTVLKATPADRRRAAWLHAQFCVAKSTGLKKGHVGPTFIRESNIWHESFTKRAPKLGGLVEFHRPPARVQWTPTGVDIPDYSQLTQLWWQDMATPPPAPRRPRRRWTPSPRRRTACWSGRSGPKCAETAARASREPQGGTADYGQLIRSWSATPPRRS